MKLKYPPPRKITVITGFGGKPERNWEYTHDILLIMSNMSKTGWYIDLTSEQFGLPRTFWPVLEYHKAYVQDGTWSFVEPGANWNNRVNGDRGELEDKAGELLNEAINNQVKENIPLHELVKIDNEASFQGHKRSLLNAMDQTVKAFVREITWLDWNFKKQMTGSSSEMQQDEK